MARQSRPFRPFADDDPDILRYQAERARRQQRVEPLIEAANRKLQELEAREREARKPGRPRKGIVVKGSYGPAHLRRPL